MQPILRVAEVTKAFDGTPILKGVSFEIAQGELVSIIGPSGCGKSTLLRCLNGLETFDTGSVEIYGVRMARGPGAGPQPKDTPHRLRRNVGMVFQGFNLFPHRTLLQNVMMAPMVVKNTDREEAAGLAEHLLRKVGLSEQMDRYPVNLSGGQQQRGAIARALAMAPKVMLYDEPTAVLDPALVDEVLDVMRQLGAEGLTQIVVTQEMRFAREADRVVYMEAGEIVEISGKGAIFERPQDPRTRQFLECFA